MLTGYRIRLSLRGCAGTKDRRPDTLQAVWRAGRMFFNTAPVYGPGLIKMRLNV